MENQLKASTRVLIPVEEAILKTTQWRNFIKSVLNYSDPNKLAKGVYISRADIEDMAGFCQSDDKIVGVRAYFTLENDHIAFPYDNEVKFVMVLVRESPHHPWGQDIPYMPEGPRDVIGASNVYDFTRPCPDSCDVTSVLYGNQRK